MPKEVVVKIHPPTAGVAVLCIDGGGTRGVLPLKFMQRIQDRIGLPMPLQRFFKVVVGTSSGKYCKDFSKAYLTLLRGSGCCWTIRRGVDGRRVLREFSKVGKGRIYRMERSRNSFHFLDL
jgi:hypothetical protein